MSLSPVSALKLGVGLFIFAGCIAFVLVALYIAYTKLDVMLGYFKNNGFVEVQKMFGLVKNNVYKKGNITIVMSTETSNRINNWVVTVFNDDVKKEVEEKQNSSLNKNINENFKEIDAFLK